MPITESWVSYSVGLPCFVLQLGLNSGISPRRLDCVRNVNRGSKNKVYDMSFDWVLLMRDPFIEGSTVVYEDFAQRAISRRTPKTQPRAKHSKTTKSSISMAQSTSTILKYILRDRPLHQPPPYQIRRTTWKKSTPRSSLHTPWAKIIISGNRLLLRPSSVCSLR